jgi:DeoR family fructose operon transcriptional repressor
MGTNGISVERGHTTPDIDEPSDKRGLIDAARRTVGLADQTKFGREDFARVAPLSDIDTVITDIELDVELAEDIENAGPRLVVV